MINNHHELSDLAFEQQFSTSTLAEHLFTHEAHLRLAWIHINKYGIDKAIENVTGQLLRFVDRLGAKDKYNETLTVAALKMVNHFNGKAQTKNFNAFIAEFPKLNTHFKELINTHYSINLLHSAEAKARYLEPDLLSF